MYEPSFIRWRPGQRFTNWDVACSKGTETFDDPGRGCGEGWCG